MFNIQTIIDRSSQILPNFIQNNEISSNSIAAFSGCKDPHTLAEMIARNAILSPKNIACKDKKEINFETLDQLSNQTARFLENEFNIKSGDCVAIAGFNQVNTLVAMLAVLKLGAVFCIYEPNIPEKRLLSLLDESRARCIITSDNLFFYKDKYNQIICNLSLKEPQITNESLEPLDQSKFDDSLPAYLLFTSGSTSSVQKAVVQTRNGLMGQMIHHAHDLKLTSEDRLLVISSIAHDQALCCIFGALTAGASLFFYDMRSHESDRFLQFIKSNKITVFTSIPSAFACLFENTDLHFKADTLRLVRFGGEATHASHVRIYQRITTDDCLLGIGYGATECSWISYLEMTKEESRIFLENKSPSLGKFSGHINYFIEGIDSNNPTIGELCVSSPYLSDGYYNSDEITKKAYFTKEDKRYYKTGDIVECKNETIHYLGRKEGHVKISGVRINIWNIENILNRESVKSVQIIVLPYGEDDNVRLCGFWTGKTDDIDSLKYLSRLYLTPQEHISLWVKLDQFPLLPNKKIDRQSLKEKISAMPQKTKSSKCDDLSYINEKVREILNWPETPADFTNLSELDSLQKMQLINNINRNLIYPISYGMFQCLVKIKDIKNVITDLSTKTPVWDKKEVIPSYHFKNQNNFEKMENGECMVVEDVNHIPLELNFASLKVLAEHYFKKSGIKIIPCESHQDFISQMESFYAEGKPCMIGLIWQRQKMPSVHMTSCILQVDENKNASLFIADSVNKSPSFAFVKNFIDFSKEVSFDLKVYFESYIRQIDHYSCSVDTFTYLKEVLENKDLFLKQKTTWMLDKGHHRHQGVPDGAASFSTPSVLLKYSQSLSFFSEEKELMDFRKLYEDKKIWISKTTDLEIKTLIKDFSKQNPSDYDGLIKLLQENKVNYLEKPINTALYAKGDEYKKIIDEYLYQFSDQAKYLN